MAKSILQNKTGGECYLCKMLLGIDTPAPCREEHHVMHGTANRRLSEQYGLKVYLCPYHHRTGPEAVHRCQSTDTALKLAAQRAFEQKHSHRKWMEIFGKNYLDPAAPGTLPELATSPPEYPRRAAVQESADTWKNQQNEPFSQVNISQKTPSGFCFQAQDPGKEGL